MTSPYALHGEKICDLGYSCIPCRPGSKRPGAYQSGEWFGRNDWQQYCDRAPTAFEQRTWDKWPDAGVCVALGFGGVVAIDVDTDELDICAALSEVMPASMVQKRGQKGFTAFYRASPAVKSAWFNVKESRVVDLLAHGKQTVIPPTLHPDTGQRYEWLTDETLENTHPRDLPMLPDDIAEQIADALKPFGYAPPTQARAAGDGAYGDTIWRDLNTMALARLDDWIPALDLYKCKRNSRGGYVCVPTWRASNRGRPTHERSPNLKISPDGIRDFHDGDKGYTPIDLVMAQLGCGLDFADNWLRERVRYQEPRLYGLAEWWPKKKDGAPAVAAPAAPAPVAAVAAPRGTVDPFDPTEAGGLLGHIAEWAIESGRRPVPEFAMMTAIAFLSGLYGRRFVGPTGAGLNLYLVGLGGSALGKGHPLKALRTIASDCGFAQLVAAGDPTADSAIERALRISPTLVMPWDEFGLVLQSVNGKGASSWSRTVRRALLELYSLSADTWHGKQYADPKRAAPSPVHCPTLSILGMTTPGTFYEGLTVESLSDGFMNRMTVIHATVVPERRRAPPLMITTPSLVAAIKKADEEAMPPAFGRAKYRDHSQRPDLMAIPWESDAVEERWLKIEDWQIEEIEERQGHEGIVGRAAEQTIKLATIRALARSGPRAKVTMADVEWGYSIVQRSLDCIDKGVREFMASSEFEGLCKAILSALRKAANNTMPMSALLRVKGISKSEDRLVTSAIDRLVNIGDVVRMNGRNGTGKSVRLASAPGAAAGAAAGADSDDDNG